MEFIWDSVLSLDWFLFRSPFFFLLIAQTTQFVACLLFSAVDLYRGRIPLHLITSPAINALLGFFPFALMWYTGILFAEVQIQRQAPSLFRYFAELGYLVTIGDFMHYWTHRLLHSNIWLRTHVHSVHHKYEGPLYCWIGMQVHPAEAVMINTAIFTPLVVFAHPMVLWTMTIMATINATFAHSGYHGGFASIGVPMALTSNGHKLHHEHDATKNYGNIFKVWDMVFGTYG